MATEKETREAIAAVIGLVVASSVTVIPRDVMGMFRQGHYSALLASGATQTRGWMVTQKAMPLNERGDAYAEYKPLWHIWQLHEYFTGDNSSNSEDIASAERETVMAALANPSAVSGVEQATLDALKALMEADAKMKSPTGEDAPVELGALMWVKATDMGAAPRR